MRKQAVRGSTEKEKDDLIPVWLGVWEAWVTGLAGKKATTAINNTHDQNLLYWELENITE